MSIDRSLKSRSALVRTRNVLTRAERLIVLQDQERWEEGNSVFGLPKVAQKKRKARKKEAKEETAVEGAPAEGEATTEDADKS